MSKQKASHKDKGVIELHTDDTLDKLSRDKFKGSIGQYLQAAKEGKQVAIVDGDGIITTVVGMNGKRYLPESDYDPITEPPDVSSSPRVDVEAEDSWLD